MAIGSLPPVINEIQANSGQPGKTLAQQTSTSLLLDLQAAATAEPTTAIVPETTLLERAVAEALGRQGGLASLYATLTELAKAPDLPDAVKAAVNTLLAFRLDESDVTPERVAQAIRSSGVFHEAVAAGKMAAALPPAVRQALGGTPEEKAQAAARPVIASGTAAAPTVAAKPVASSPQPSPASYNGPPANAGTSAAAAQAYGRQAGAPAQSAPPSAPQVMSPAAAAVGANATTANQGTEISTAPSASPATPASGSTIQTATASSSTSSGTVPAQPAVSGEAPAVSNPASSPSRGGLPAASNAAEDASVSIQQQTSTSKVDETPPTSPTIEAAKTPKVSPPIVSGASAGVTQNSQTSSPNPTLLPPGAADALPTPQSVQPSDRPDVEAPTQQPLAASPSNGAPTARSFAPWTPGRPMTTATSQASPDTPGALVPSQAPSASSSSMTVPPTSETGVARLLTDRAPFVPSAVESLPNAASGTAAQKTPVGSAPPVTAPVAPHQSGPVAQPVTSHSSVVPQATVSSPQTSSEPSQLTSPQARAVTPPSSEVPPLLARQAVSQAALPTTTLPQIPGLDLKGAIDLLRRELITWLGRNADVMASLDGASDDGSAPRVDRPQPPRKGGPVRGQPAINLLGGDETDPSSTEALAGRALGEAERSLSRVFLHQAATAESRDSTKAAQVAQAFVLEIPIAGPNGTSIAQLRIERDDHAPSEPGTPPRRVFQVDIAFDIVPLGPVAVRVGLMDGRRVAVGVWCESDDGLVRMEAERENIVLGLEQEGMVVAGVDLHRGHPPEGHDESVAAPSHRLDLQL